MLISLNWIRDFVDLPGHVTAVDLADRFTLTCAQVEGVEAIQIGAEGLICAELRGLERVEESLHVVALNVGEGKAVETVTAAPNLAIGDRVVYAPTGASVKALGTIRDASLAGRRSSGMILPGEALGIALAAREAILLPPNVPPGTLLEPSLFDDWVIEIDNHSINHRPDLWGHYGVARELAAIYGRELLPYPVVALEELEDVSLPEIPIEIDDPELCPRYSGLLMKRVESRPAPLWMQLRLGHVGLRPLDCLVDLTNYIMLELGQPMHAFDGDGIDVIEVCTAEAGTKFTTFDNVEQTLPDGALMITCHRKPIALAGIMGGSETEISATTKTILLESANFNPYTIRKCANSLGHRTDASTRFEKSLDPAHTVLGIQRFVHLGKAEFANLTLASRLSDAYPKPLAKVSVSLDPEYVGKFMGHEVTRQRIIQILEALEFKITDHGTTMTVEVPSFRATRDIEIEADIIEEIARFVGYDTIEPSYPEVSVRAQNRNPLHQIERSSLQLLTQGLGMTEIHRYLWYDRAWCTEMGYVPGDCLTLRNPAAAGMERLRKSLLPGLLAAADLNRRHFSQFKILELGSVFPGATGTHVERRRIGMLSGVRSKAAEDQRLAELKGNIDTWAWQILSHPATFHPVEAEPTRPWEHSAKTAGVHIGGREVGRVSAVPFELRRKMDEHLAAWSFVWAELELDGLTDMTADFSKLSPVPAFPEVELDFSVLVDATRRYADVRRAVAEFDDQLLRRITFVDSYDGESAPTGKRAMTLRACIGDPKRTLVDADLVHFREAFQQHLANCRMELRTS